MKVITILLIIIGNLLSAQQIETKRIKVINIEREDNSYIIKGINNRDTIILISKMEKLERRCDYKKIKKYLFELLPMPNFYENLTFRVGKRILWKSGDNPKAIPRYLNNTNGIYIKK